MEFYKNIHHQIEGLTKEAVDGGHQKSLEVEEKYDEKNIKYWFDETSGKIFCLVDTPSIDRSANL